MRLFVEHGEHMCREEGFGGTEGHCGEKRERGEQEVGVYKQYFGKDLWVFVYAEP